MRAGIPVVLAMACGGDPAGAGKGPGAVAGDDTAEDSGVPTDDTGGATALAPAWVQLGNTRVRATHVVLTAASERRAGTVARGLSLESRGWGAVGFGGALSTPAGTQEVADLEVENSEMVDAQAYVEGRLVPADPCTALASTWTPPEGELTDVALRLSPVDGQNCDVDGTTRPPLLSVGFGGGAEVSFSGEVLSLSLGDPRESCTLQAFDREDETLSQTVDCGTSLGWEDGDADAVPGGARLSGGVLTVGVVAGSAELVGQP